MGTSLLARGTARLRRHGWEEPGIDRAYARWLRHPPPLPAVPGGGSPRISVLMPVHETSEAWLRAAIASVEAQRWQGWELCIADDASTASHVASLLQEAAAREPRIRIVNLRERQGIAGATNAAAALAGGDYFAFLDHDDLLAPEALAVMAAAARAHPMTGLLFSDEDQLVGGERRAPYFKPGWNPDLLLQQNLVCHLAVCRRDLFVSLGGMRAGFEGAQDHDFALRALARLGTGGIRHVPHVLYHWRQDPGSFSAAAASRCREAAARAIALHAGPGAALQEDPDLPGWQRLAFDAPAASVGVLTPRAPGGPQDVLVFLDPALRPAHGVAVAALAGQALQPGVGIAGGRIESGRGRVVHGGYALDPARIADPARGAAGDPGYRGRFRLARTVAAVSGSCLAVRGDLFRGLGGWRAEAESFAAIDLCLRAAEAGWRTVWTPAARFIGEDAPLRAGAAWMRGQWADTLSADPYVNPHLPQIRGKLHLDRRMLRQRPRTA